ncbi:MAG TPA: nucleotidyltransferase family protein [Usitatibacter sp.]|nr:nucleotidyltransferase family protein [Usitatibacter sp.]
MIRQALILAAGRGERLRPLTDATPKPLLAVGGRALIEWQIERLKAAGFHDLVVNHAHLGALIETALGDGRRLGVRIRYSAEAPALETAGGVAKALALLDRSPFVVVSGDIHTEFDYATLAVPMEAIARDPVQRAAHFVLVDNPPWHAAGDMGLATGRIVRDGARLTYGNIAVFHPSLFREIASGTRLKLFPWAYRFVDEGRVTGEHYRGAWDNVGTPEQLLALDRRLSK